MQTLRRSSVFAEASAPLLRPEAEAKRYLPCRRSRHLLSATGGARTRRKSQSPLSELKANPPFTRLTAPKDSCLLDKAQLSEDLSSLPLSRSPGRSSLVHLHGQPVLNRKNILSPQALPMNLQLARSDISSAAFFPLYSCMDVINGLRVP